MSAVKTDLSLVRKALERQSQEPFIDLLATWLECKPTKAAIREMAKEKPHLWMKSMKELSTLAGYQGETGDTTNILMINNLSDVDLEAKLKAIQDQLAGVATKAAVTIDAELEPRDKPL